ncbi:hypothetical protein LJ737_06820 [Hymenobacter sp. 15J16-1T3B]|uniref:hypothetical protein n=1 Tax=Hymenobacter sp. 15J16-1T3B TaxID=2886941 RepID=UPI001D10AD9A|nr:hypothetical protein [Hymenobacter sp. 15J16-1T3B]MCC3156942.1 hypothetical protein [Hymenobacter sp. 15J16-1T3B]
MKNFITLGALVISLALIVYLYVRLSAAERELAQAKRHVADCEQVTFQLQNQLTAQARDKAAAAGQPVPGEQE